MVGERMKRKQPQEARPTKRIKNIKKAFSAAQRSEMAAIALVWNEIDFAINMLLQETLHLDEKIWLDVVVRINGMDGKLAIIKMASERTAELKKYANLFATSIDAVTEYKGYRDALIHCMQFDTQRHIAQYIQNRATFIQILVAVDALKALYRRLVFLRDEVEHIFFVTQHYHEEKKGGIVSLRPQDQRESFAAFHAQRSARYIPKWLAIIQKTQRKRVALGPLPLFPKEPGIPPAMVGK